MATNCSLTENNAKIRRKIRQTNQEAEEAKECGSLPSSFPLGPLSTSFFFVLFRPIVGEPGTQLS